MSGGGHGGGHRGSHGRGGGGSGHRGLHPASIALGGLLGCWLRGRHSAKTRARHRRVLKQRARAQALQRLGTAERAITVVNWARIIGYAAATIFALCYVYIMFKIS